MMMKKKKKGEKNHSVEMVWLEFNFLQNESTYIRHSGEEECSECLVHAMTFNLMVSPAEQICGTSATQSSFIFNFVSVCVILT